MPSLNLSTANSLAIFSPTEAQAIATDLLSRLQAQEALVLVTTSAYASAQFAKNDVTKMVGSSNVKVSLSVTINNLIASGGTQDISVDGLAAMVAEVENLAKTHRDTAVEGLVLGPPESFKDPPIYFESSLTAAAPAAQGDLIRSVADLAEKAGVIGAGGISSMARSLFIQTTTGFKGYSRLTGNEFTMTARTSSGTGSGWAWGGGEDFSQVNVLDVAQRAIDLAKRSENPVAVEPGRYTVILEPEAVEELISFVIGSGTEGMQAEGADAGRTVFSKKGGGNKLGHKMTDDRVQLFYDPDDPLRPFSPLNQEGRIMHRTHWIENGILKNLAYYPHYARQQKREVLLNPGTGRLEITSPAQTLEQMIASTQRGIWVHRFSAVSSMDAHTLLLSGLTRDGTFLIENGRVTKPVKNMRFSESPFFILNKLEAAGVPVRSGGMVCPRLKVFDFEFTSLSDAI
jgi:predicted Zn-dependent protease